MDSSAREGADFAQESKRQHLELSRDGKRLRDIASELDELTSTHIVEQWAKTAGTNPSDTLLYELQNALAGYRSGLESHFAREEKSFPRLASLSDAPGIVRLLEAQHKHALSSIEDISTRIALLLQAGVAPAARQEMAHCVASSLRELVGMMSAHAEKEDEILFIMGHNV